MKPDAKSNSVHVSDAMLSQGIIAAKLALLREQYAHTLAKPETERDSKWMAYAAARIDTLTTIQGGKAS